ncbi:MAG: hypothetical protein AAB532_02295 [Patescibacteria group bacterium]
MNIDIESIGLLSLILQDSPKDRQLILCVLARSNTVPTRITYNPNTDYPTFYGYSNSRTPLYLMGKGLLSNVPREGYAKRLISSHYLSHAETIINRANNWDIHQKLMSVSKFITLDNKTAYKDAELFLVFRDKTLDYIKGYSTSHQEEVSTFLGTSSKGVPKAEVSVKQAQPSASRIESLYEKIAEVDEQIRIRREAWAKAQSTISDNPFYAEATRTGHLAKLEQQAQTDIGNFIKQKETYLTELNLRKADTQSPKTQQTKQIETVQANKSVYEVRYSEQTREILINGFLLKKLRSFSDNDAIFSYLYKNPNEDKSAEEIKNASKIESIKDLNKFLDDIGFAGELRKAFFKVSKGRIQFNNPITREYLEEIDIERLKLK